ncbi:UNVERIFIED_CONTAM: DUF5347 domain-containing protein [Escherichia coli]
MAIEGAAATVPLSPGERLNGLNHIAELRAKVFGLNIESELERFIKDMRDPRDINSEQNKRALAAIFFMAKIPAERHSISINELTTDEKRELIKEGANKQVISSQADSLIKISRIWADFFPANTSNQPI